MKCGLHMPPPLQPTLIWLTTLLTFMLSNSRATLETFHSVNFISILFLKYFHLLAFMKPSFPGFVLSALQSILLAAALMILNVNSIPAQIFQWPPKFLPTSPASKSCPSLQCSLPFCHTLSPSISSSQGLGTFCSLDLEYSSHPDPNILPS